MNIGIILAAGNSNRYQNSLPKQFHSFKDKMLVEYSIDTFYKHPEIDEVLLLVPKKYYNFSKQKIKNCKIFVGGKKRQESSFIALMACPKNTKNVLIHDAARPFVNNKIINECLRELKNNVAVCPALPCVDTIVEIQKETIIKKILNRNVLYKLQTPQAFDYKLLLECHKKLNRDVTDDISIIQEHGYIPKIILGNEKNMKITYKDDLKIIESLL